SLFANEAQMRSTELKLNNSSPLIWRRSSVSSTSPTVWMNPPMTVELGEGDTRTAPDRKDLFPSQTSVGRNEDEKTTHRATGSDYADLYHQQRLWLQHAGRKAAERARPLGQRRNADSTARRSDPEFGRGGADGRHSRTRGLRSDRASAFAATERDA